MKHCPTCYTQYTDDTLRFCLQDGTPLQPALGEPAPTVAYHEQETVVSNRRSDPIITPPVTNPTNWQPAPISSNANYQTPEKRSGVPVAVFATAFILLLFFGAAGAGLWLYYKGVTRDPNANLLLAKKSPDPDFSKTASNSASNPTKTTATPSATTAANAATPTPVDAEQVKRDVAARVDSWKAAAESHDLDGYMSNYAETVDYYTKSRISRGSVRSDKQRAFDAYSSLRYTISNLSVTPDASGNNATAVFDKEWYFSGAKTSAGKVRSELRLTKVGGKWLIAGEKDLKLYYKE
ncbi:MAG: hypothetical protein JSS81_10870 [Acidobacteria bacterium]|nr:hypothetical protein [Acidobacteriota bacterium]